MKFSSLSYREGKREFELCHPTQGRVTMRLCVIEGFIHVDFVTEERQVIVPDGILFTSEQKRLKPVKNAFCFAMLSEVDIKLYGERIMQLKPRQEMDSSVVKMPMVIL